MASYKNVIDKDVLYTQIMYDERLRNIKEDFIKGLYDNVPPEEIIKKFENELTINHDFMEQLIEELQIQIAEKDHITMLDLKRKLPNKYELVPIEDFKRGETEYLKRVSKFYESRYKTIQNVPDKEAYTTKQIEKFDKVEKFITYYHHGMPWSKQKLSTYNSMLFNVNLTKARMESKLQR